METLFTRNFRVARISASDAKWRSDHLETLVKLIAENEPLYPGINPWLSRKVLPGLIDGSRVAFIGYENERPIITAVVKTGDRTKFCHLRVEDAFQDIRLGEVFFALMAVEARHTANEIHFTLPESLWLDKRGFFESFGFRNATPSAIQYRLFERELVCSAPFKEVWRSVLEKLPAVMNSFTVNEYSLRPRLLFSIKHEYAEKVLDGTKTVEVRRRFARKWSGERIALYSSRPISALVGEATIRRVKVGAPEVIWDEFGSQLGCSAQEFKAYTDSCDEVYAITFEDVRPYAERIPLAQAEALTKEELAPPQSYCELGDDRPWAKAVSLAALLHGSLRRKFASEQSGFYKSGGVFRV